jgi:LysR family glycine cleavage system transcriptional activator
MRRFPPLHSVRGFEAVARLSSFRKAADELCVTHSAISHQVRQLEEALGVALFRRGPRSIEMTSAGEHYYPIIREALTKIADATETVQSANAPDVLSIHAHSSFAQLWLVPRLPHFRAAFPNIEVRVATATEITFLRGEFDVGFVFGPVAAQNIVAHELFRSQLYPVCSPQLMEHSALVDPAQLRAQTLLQVYSPVAIDDWARWLTAAGVLGDLPKGPHFDTYALALQAAAHGMGIAMTRDHFSHQDLQSGRLVEPFSIRVPADEYWYLAYHQDRSSSRKVKAFRDWVMEVSKNSLVLPELTAARAVQPHVRAAELYAIS